MQVAPRNLQLLEYEQGSRRARLERCSDTEWNLWCSELDEAGRVRHSFRCEALVSKEARKLAREWVETRRAAPPRRGTYFRDPSGP